MQKCAKKQSYFFTIACLITFCCVLINKLSFYTDCPKIPELVKQCFSNLSMSKCLIVSALSSAFPNDFPIFCVYRLIKSIYLQKCTALDKLRTVHFFFLQACKADIRNLLRYLLMNAVASRSIPIEISPVLRDLITVIFCY